MQAFSKGAVVQKSPYEAPTIDKAKCTDCEACTYFCAFGTFEVNLNLCKERIRIKKKVIHLYIPQKQNYRIGNGLIHWVLMRPIHT